MYHHSHRNPTLRQSPLSHPTTTLLPLNVLKRLEMRDGKELLEIVERIRLAVECVGTEMSVEGVEEEFPKY
jgi:hypothetical protein